MARGIRRSGVAALALAAFMALLAACGLAMAAPTTTQADDPDDSEAARRRAAQVLDTTGSGMGGTAGGGALNTLRELQERRPGLQVNRPRPASEPAPATRRPEGGVGTVAPEKPSGIFGSGLNAGATQRQRVNESPARVESSPAAGAGTHGGVTSVPGAMSSGPVGQVRGALAGALQFIRSYRWQIATVAVLTLVMVLVASVRSRTGRRRR